MFYNVVHENNGRGVHFFLPGRALPSWFVFFALSQTRGKGGTTRAGSSLTTRGMYKDSKLVPFAIPVSDDNRTKRSKKSYGQSLIVV